MRVTERHIPFAHGCDRFWTTITLSRGDVSLPAQASQGIYDTQDIDVAWTFGAVLVPGLWERICNEWDVMMKCVNVLVV